MKNKTPFELPPLQPVLNAPVAPSAADEPARNNSNPLLNGPSPNPSDELVKKRVSPFSQFSYDKTPSTNLTDPLLNGEPAKPWRPRRTLRDYRHLVMSAARHCVYYGLHYIVILGVVVLLSLALGGIEVDAYRSAGRLENHRQLVLTATELQVVLGMMCSSALDTEGLTEPMPTPSLLDELARRIKKLSHERQKRYMPYVYTVKDALDTWQCQKIFPALGELVALLTVDLQRSDHPRISSNARLFVVYAVAMAELREDGPMDFRISQPVTSDRALRVMGGNLFCAPQMHYLMLSGDPDADRKLFCLSGQDAAEVIAQTPINNPLRSPISVEDMFFVIDEVWQQANEQRNPYERNTVHLIIIILLLVTAAGSMLLLLRLSLHQHRAHRRHNLIQQDFVLHNGKVAIRPQTLCALDYYCWKAGSMETVDVQEVRRYGANNIDSATYAIEAASYAESDSFTGVPHQVTSAPSPHMSPQVPTIPTSPGTTPTGPVRSPGKSNEPSNVEKDRHATHEMPMARSLLAEAKARRKRLRAFVREARQLHGLTQMELYMHRIVAPLLLLRPFLPSAMMQRFLYDPHNDAGLGPSLSELATCSVLQDGLEPDHAVYVFVSFRKYNTSEALGLATKHFVQLDAERQEREDLARAEESKHAFFSCCGGGGRHGRKGEKSQFSYSRIGDDDTNADHYGAGQYPTRPLGARLLGDDGFDFAAEAEAAAQAEQMAAAAAAAEESNPLHRHHHHQHHSQRTPDGSNPTSASTGDAMRTTWATTTTSVAIEGSVKGMAHETRSGTSTNPLSQSGQKGELTHPLSPLAVGLCYVLTYARHASNRFHGELVQVSSDGILIQFRNGRPRQEREHYCPHVKDTIEQLGLTSDEDDNGDDIHAYHGMGQNTMRQANMSGDSYDRLCSNSELAYTSGDIEVNGRRIYMSAEERAVRTAYSIQRSLDHCLDFEDNRYIPLDLLQCPIVVLSDRASLRGRVGFHVTRHYTVLSQCIPVLFPLEQLCLEYNAGLVMTEDVYECVEGSTVARPFHFLAVGDLNCYRFDMKQNESFEAKWRLAEHHGRHGLLHSGSGAEHKSGGSTVGMIGDGTLKAGRSLGDGAFTRRHAEEANGLNNSISHVGASEANNNNSHNSSTTSNSSNVEVHDGLNPNRDHATTVRSFSVTGSVYEVLNVRSVNSNFESEETSGENRSRNQVRHTHWKLIWDKYVQLIGYRGSMRVLTAYARAFNTGKAKKSLEEQQQQAALESEGLDTEVDARPSYLTNSEDISSSSLFSMSASQSETLHVKELLTVVCDELHDCYHELLAYKRVYGVRKHEEYSFQRVEQEVLAMLKALGEVAEEGHQDNENKF